MTHTFRNDCPDTFISVVREVGQGLTEAGDTLWEVDTLTAENLFDEHTRHNSYVLFVAPTGQNGPPVPAGTFMLQWASPIYFPDVPPHTAGFIHKLAIRRAFAGQGLFQPILDFCRTECLRRGIHELQLETDATRPALMRFYERHGFTPTFQRTNHEFGQTFTCQYYVLRF